MNLLEKLRMFNRELVKENARLSKIYANMCESAAESGTDLNEIDEGIGKALAGAALGAGIGAAAGGVEAGGAFGLLSSHGGTRGWDDFLAEIRHVVRHGRGVHGGVQCRLSAGARLDGSVDLAHVRHRRGASKTSARPHTRRRS